MEMSRRDAILGTVALAATPLMTSTETSAAAPVAGKQAPSFYRYKVGDIVVTVVSDGKNVFPLTDAFIPNAKRDDINAALEKAFMPRDMISIWFAPLVIQSGGKLIVLDTGTGPVAKVSSKGANGLFLENMTAAGFDPRAVDMVVISHFHTDHVNGLLTSDGKPAFPNAEVLVPSAEWKFWCDDGEMSRAKGERMVGLFKNNRNIFETGLKKKVTPYDWNKEIAPGLISVETVGHTHLLCALFGIGQGVHPVGCDQQSVPVRGKSLLASGIRSGWRHGGKDPPPRLRHGGRRQAPGAGFPLSVSRPWQRSEGWRRLPGRSGAVESGHLTASQARILDERNS